MDPNRSLIDFDEEVVPLPNQSTPRNNSFIGQPNESFCPFENPPRSPRPSPLSSQSEDVDRLVGAIGRLVEGMSMNVGKDEKIDISHIPPFKGSGEELTVCVQLHNFLFDFEDLFNSRNLSELDKMRLVRRKLGGSALTIYETERPINFNALKALLRQTFGKVRATPHQLIDELNKMKIHADENLIQFFARAKQRAIVIALKAETTIQSVLVFEPLSQLLLSVFDTAVSFQQDVREAIENRDVGRLIDTLDNIATHNPKALLPRPKSKPVTVVCANCQKSGHTVKDCRHAKQPPLFF